jgi:hypothetical protein
LILLPDDHSSAFYREPPRGIDEIPVESIPGFAASLGQL